MSTATTPPAEEQTEGNVTEIDLENRYLLIEDRTGAPFMKLFWNISQEEFDGKPTPLINQIRKLKVGYYVAPIITGVDTSISGKIKEAYLKGLPFKERGDFPRMQQKKGFGGGFKGQPRNEKAIILQTCLKVAADVWIAGSDKTLKYEEVMAKITTEAIKAADALSKASGGV